jgi:predicted Holliday junction resolvase-like endonuclease
MLLSDLLIPVLVALVIGFVLGYFYVKGQITAIEERCRADLERWKIEAGNEIRKDSVNRSRSTLKGKIAEQMAPIMPNFAFNPADARFIGSPVDYIIFDGLTDVADDQKTSIRIVFMDVKKGAGKLTRVQRIIKKAVEDKEVAWQTLHLADE